MPSFQSQWITLGFIVTMFWVVIWFDILAAHCWGPDATISRVLIATFRRCPVLYPIFWLSVGLLVGHFGLPASE
jgi:hypothetical protein